jgi:hypothetical protein
VLTDNNLPSDDHAAEVEALGRRYPRWTIWFGLATRSWWALPPREQDTGGFVEAATPQKLIARIETHPAVPAPAGHPPVPASAHRPQHQPARPNPHHPAHQAPHQPARHPVRDPRQDAWHPSNLLRLEGAAPPPAHRVSAAVRPGGTAR